ncbi:MAG: nucleotidyl transferase AbiEii/AbiGii toxin family protein [Deltaproteobacteria bacterium]|nr:nucleotidyl transferase AbiEii/AbiGii toxin family protein [Deltaproteobacteria bacterium]
MPNRSTPSILTPLQRRFLQAAFHNDWFRRHFYLTGGTALSAFYLQHRYSEDLDFFTHSAALDGIAPMVATIAKQLKVSSKALQTTPGFQRYLLSGDLKLDFVVETEFRIGTPELIDDFMVDCLKNIAVNKVCTILGRLDVKDYVDLFFLLTKQPFDIYELMEHAQQKDGGMDRFIWASLIADIKTLQIMPRMIAPLTKETLDHYFLGLRDQILDSINPKTIKK